jgi:hypothetical protein
VPAPREFQYTPRTFQRAYLAVVPLRCPLARATLDLASGVAVRPPREVT